MAYKVCKLCTSCRQCCHYTSNKSI